MNEAPRRLSSMSSPEYYYKSVSFHNHTFYRLKEGERVYDRACHKGVWTLLITNEPEPEFATATSTLEPLVPGVSLASLP
jgi:hypothetical protein